MTAPGPHGVVITGIKASLVRTSGLREAQAERAAAAAEVEALIRTLRQRRAVLAEHARIYRELAEGQRKFLEKLGRADDGTGEL